VLALLVLVSGLTLALLSTVRTEAASAAGFERGVSTRTLAETALNLVIGQVQEATERPGEAWISQPGLIRSYDDRGNPSAAYKLYSAEKMKIDGAFDPADGEDLPADVAAWKDDVNQWVDLNAPIKSVSGNGSQSYFYPIIDPRAAGSVEGFSYNSTWSSVTSAPESLALPVRWLYLLEDGTLTPAGNGTNEQVDIPGSTPSNPPIARIAFWTDDESSKVNVNTASEGTYWDTPITNTWPSAAGVGVKPVSTSYVPDPRNQYELDLAWFQGRQREYQRYPGHPATTSLLPVLGKPLADRLGITYPPPPTERNRLLNALYEITPRFTGNMSSEGGTLSIRQNLPPGGAMPVKSDRLYASLDEALFDPGQPGVPRAKQELGATSEEAAELLQQTGFFLTANSRAPEVNLFGKPRVAIWPLTTPRGAPDSEARMTAFDKLIKFCATVGSTRYAFTRSNPDSPTQDLQGTSRNLQIYEYLQRLTGQAVPGFGGTFSAKYGAGERDQILTQIVDYIRCTNLVDVTDPGIAFTPVDPASQGQVIPLEGPNNTRGFGRIATVSEIFLGFRRLSATVNGGVEGLEAVIIPELFSPMAGFPAMAVNMRITFSGLDSFKVNGRTIFPSPSHSPINIGRLPGGHSSRFGGLIGPLHFLNNGPGTEFLLPTGRIPWSDVSGNATMAVEGTLNVMIEAPVSAPQVVQQFSVSFPASPWPIPANAAIGEEWVMNTTSQMGIKMRPGQATGQMFNGARDAGRSIVPSHASGDLRLVAASKNPTRFFSAMTGSGRLQNTLRDQQEVAGGFSSGSLFPGAAIGPSSSPGLPPTVSVAGDWDNGPSLNFDGPLLNKADEGSTQPWEGGAPYIGHRFGYRQITLNDASAFSPNKMMPSPVVFGSLPTGVSRDLPWQTLLFRPAKSWLPGGANHPGAATSGNPADHLLLDLFWMPVVEPYAISEPFATAGKLNLNYQIAPFTYVTRKTGLHAAMHSLKMPALNPSARPGNSSIEFQFDYKSGGKDDPAIRRADNTWPGQDIIIRREVDIANTLRQVDERFANNKPFISASEICDVPLIPADIPNTHGAKNAGITASTPVTDFDNRLASFWSDHRLTGDNSLERPYAHLYPRLTTQSNTFTVHVRVQRLMVTPVSLQAGVFSGKRDKVTGEFRGSFTIERYLDPNSDGLVRKQGADYVPAGENDPAAFLGPYKIRVIHSKRLSL
jgi:hypothetical protein